MILYFAKDCVVSGWPRAGAWWLRAGGATTCLIRSVKDLGNWPIGCLCAGLRLAWTNASDALVVQYGIKWD